MSAKNLKIFTKFQKRILIAFGITASLFVSLAVLSTLSNALEVHFLDVGQGDAIFIQTPNRRQILVDGGYDKDVLEKLGKYMPFYDRSIDLVIATHMDKDHIGGLYDVLDKFEVETVLIFADVVYSQYTTSADSKYAMSGGFDVDFFEKVKESRAKLVVVEAGDRFWIDEDIYFDILWPSKNSPQNLSDNNKSLVLKLNYKNDSFLLTGDIEKFAEYKLAQSNINLEADILKIAHHGSNTSSVKYFLDKVQAKFVVIQVGKNTYGHPHNAVLERLSGMEILRNDINGDISIYSYGNSL